MSDKALQAIRKKRLEKLKKNRFFNEKKNNYEIDPNKILNKLFVGRAWEVYNASVSQFPIATKQLKKLLVKLALEKKISYLNGEQLLTLIRQLGFPVKLKNAINYLGKGKTKPLSEKLKESLK